MHTTQTKVNDSFMEVSRITPGWFLNTQWHRAKTVEIPPEEGFSACKNFHTVLEMKRTVLDYVNL